MQMITTNCPACGGAYGGRFTSRFITCEYCGTRFALSADELAALGFVDADGDGYDDNDQASVAKRSRSVIDASGPIYEFAREECERFLAAVGDSNFKSTNKIIKGLNINQGDDIYLIHDDTMFKSGKNGFAITREGLYCREMGDKTAHFVSWEDFSKRKEPRLDDSYVRQDRISISYFTDDNDVRDHELIELYQRLYDYAQATQ